MGSKKMIYFFSENQTDGDATMRDILGGKGAGLAEMSRLGLPVPPGFTISTEACREYYKNGKKLPNGLWDEVKSAMRRLEGWTGKGFGSKENPLLVSVRSGAKFSMPGMMDTILNLGLNDTTVQGLAKLSGDERFAYDSYRRFISMFGDIVMNIEKEKFSRIFEEYKEKVGAKTDIELNTENLKEIVNLFKELILKEKNELFPKDPYEQLKRAIMAVFESWNNERAIAYRNFHNISHELGTAVNVCTMVFGNLGANSGTGVLFTRDPSTGEKKIYSEFLFTAQGEDVVAGIRTPLKIDEMKRVMPQIYNQLVEIVEKLEKHYKDMQDVEYTIENGKLWLLQTRSGKRTAQAAVKIAVDMVEEGLITKEEALMRVEPKQIEQLLHPRIAPDAKYTVIARGLNASPGAAIGKVVFDSNRAKELGESGEKVILVRPETNPDDVAGMIASKGILTARGGATSHASVVARGLGKPAVVGCETIKIDLDKRIFTVNDITVKEYDIITINGTTGEVILGEVPLIMPELSGEIKKFLDWADEVKRLENWANADYPRDAKKAREFGAQGIGLCRTEHMFFEKERLPWVHKMILSESAEERKIALEKIEQFQVSDFYEILKVMDGLPVIIRLLDPPLHEFLPRYEELLKEVITIELTGKKDADYNYKKELLHRVELMREANPMMGLRGCRLGITRPDINEMQVRAIFKASCRLKKDGYNPRPEIMIPLVAIKEELKLIREQLENVAKKIMDDEGVSVEYKFGTMIEVPRSALTADEIAEYAEFFSFGTNDLTQMTFAFSRDDAEGKFLFQYLEKSLLPFNPFQQIDESGVGKLMEMAVRLGRETRPELEIGICGEHGGDPESIHFCHKIGLNYVSCSPFRVPVARLAAAQAAIIEKRGKKELDR